MQCHMFCPGIIIFPSSPLKLPQGMTLPQPNHGKEETEENTDTLGDEWTTSSISSQAAGLQGGQE